MTRKTNQPPSQSSVPGLGVIIMAAGLGKRMRSNVTKVLHTVAGKPMVCYVLDLACRLADRNIGVVVGHQGGDVAKAVESMDPRVAVVEQARQLGTGHAVLQARGVFSSDARRMPSRFLILNGDTPLLSERTLRGLLTVHDEQKASVTVLTAVLDDATGYGRVIRRRRHEWLAGASDNGVLKIVEEKDASEDERAVREINVGTYVVDGNFLFPTLEKLDPRNAQGEYYLTDIVQMATTQDRRVSALRLGEADEGIGVNSRAQLAQVERIMRQRIREQWLEAGVTMRDPSSIWIDAGVVIGRDTVLYPNVTLEGLTVVGENVTIHSGVRITDCKVGDRVEILDHCVLGQSQIEDEARLGPFVHLRPGVLVRRKAKVGNFVEMKKTELGEGSKANHLSYLGDATIGRGVNIGAGTITCNYDGVRKCQTVIGDRVFLGSDAQLIAPVTIGADAIVGAGTTVTKDVPPDALAIGRAEQVNREGWASKRRALATSGLVGGNSGPSHRSVAEVKANQVSARKRNQKRSSKGQSR